MNFWRQTVRPGAVCIDATAGKGRDTALLCRLAGETGRVLAFDIQQEAVEQTEALLEREGLRAEVHLDSHANMARYVQPETVDCVVFNFGRLPGGDPKIMTRSESSLAAINAGLSLLCPGGVMAIALYYGGENGYEERGRGAGPSGDTGPEPLYGPFLPMGQSPGRAPYPDSGVERALKAIRFV